MCARVVGCRWFGPAAEQDLINDVLACCEGSVDRARMQLQVCARAKSAARVHLCARVCVHTSRQQHESARLSQACTCSTLASKPDIPDQDPKVPRHAHDVCPAQGLGLKELAEGEQRALAAERAQRSQHTQRQVGARSGPVCACTRLGVCVLHVATRAHSSGQYEHAAYL